MDEQPNNQQGPQNPAPPAGDPAALPSNPPAGAPSVPPAPEAQSGPENQQGSESGQAENQEPAAKDAPKGKEKPTQRGSFGQVKERERKRREIIRAEAHQVEMKGRIGDLIVPFVSVAVLILLIVFVFLPFGTQIVETRESTQALLEEIERNEKKVEKLSSIDLNLLEERLEKVGWVVRDEMDVAELAIEVEEMAVGRDVEPTSAEISNQEDLVESSSQLEEAWVPAYADTISGPFAYKGQFESLTDFLHALRLDSRTILSMGEIDLSYREAEDEPVGTWVASLVITGYTTEPAHETTIAAPVATEIDQELLDEVYTRASGYSDEDEDNGDSESESTEGDESDTEE